MNFTTRSIMKPTQPLNFVKIAACIVLAVGLGASAFASCGDSLAAMAAGAAAVVSQSHPMQQHSPSSSTNAVNPSIVGLWHIEFSVGDQTIQEAYQLWNVGGTEVHTPNVDPRTVTSAWGVEADGFGRDLQARSPCVELRCERKLPGNHQPQ